MAWSCWSGPVLSDDDPPLLRVFRTVVHERFPGREAPVQARKFTLLARWDGGPRGTVIGDYVRFTGVLIAGGEERVEAAVESFTDYHGDWRGTLREVPLPARAPRFRGWRRRRAG
ncbi:hypothetical protein [Nonomuraea aridisoli]|uniref:hypothetical protein n=1 Tax=Nonomuraea aridisoli TaxID=2070368 RepID=UPI0011B93690|nr:hypothetical protein [Nonomuraea aridisoli]